MTIIVRHTKKKRNDEKEREREEEERRDAFAVCKIHSNRDQSRNRLAVRFAVY